MALAWKVEEREGRGFCLFANKPLVPGLKNLLDDFLMLESLYHFLMFFESLYDFWFGKSIFLMLESPYYLMFLESLYNFGLESPYV